MTIMQEKIQKRLRDQDGFASITVALVLVIVLALLTIGFAHLARREQQSALDKQLAAQAQYAAESGINDIVDKLETSSTAFDAADPEQCLPKSNLQDQGIVDSDRDVQYTCAMVDKRPDSLITDVSDDSSWSNVFYTDQPLSELTITWSSRTGKSNPKSSPASKFSPTTQWGDSPAVLQVNLTPMGGATTDRNTLINNRFTTYMYPATSGSNSVVYKVEPQGKVLAGGSSCGNSCIAKITGITGGTGPFLINILGYYDDTHIVITGKTASNQPVKFLNSQISVDVTGKARNVLKRLQVRIPIKDGSSLPGYAIEAAAVCKRFETEPTKTTYRGDGIGLNGGVDQACELSSSD